MMDTRAKKIIITFGSIFVLSIIALLVFYFVSPKNPSTQYSDKTVIIDNYKEYTNHISPDSFGYLGNYLYEFIKNPNKGVYHGNIVSDSYAYASDSWFSKFTITLEDSDISWDVSLQTLKNGEINGDISVTCKTGSCISLSDKMNSTNALQDLLPLSTTDFIISYQKDNYDALSIIYYDEEGTGKTKALDKIKSLGFNPDDYKIDYFYGGR